METTVAEMEACRSREFGREVKALVAEHFARTGVSPHANAAMIAKSVIVAAAYFGAYLALLTGHFSWPVAWLLCVVMGFGLAGLGFSVAHDALHGAYSANPRVNGLLGLAFEALGGNGHAWSVTHNGAHHTFPNVSGYDGDVDITPLLRLSPHTPHRPVHRFQHLFALGLYGLATLNWALLKDYAYFLRMGSRPRGARAPTTGAWARLLVGKLVFYGAMALPFLVVEGPAWRILIGLLTVHLTAGTIVGVVFQLAHAVEGAEHGDPSGATRAKDGWAAHQLRSTSNFARGNALLGWYVGGLNYQVEHHLFPRVCHVHYAAISRIVEAAALRHGLPYNSIPTFGAALSSHYRTLRALGRPPVEAAV
ncbi:MAG TPA: acyl-CoA desaturase [Caulobacteraceae bacterium]|nr:acyl-CoA desaturase [Caulobacteraceae bacterium]